MTCKKLGTAGFTLLELLAAITLLAFVGGLALKFTIQGMEVHQLTRTTVNTSQHAQRGAWYIEDQVRQSLGIFYPNPGMTTPFIRLEQGDNHFHRLEIYNAGTELRRVKNTGTNPIASNITQLQFYRNERGNAFHYSFTTPGLGGEDVTYQGVVTLRYD